MKRVLQIVGSMDRGGAETMIMNLYRAIDRSKFQFDFLYFVEKECDFDKEIMSLGGLIHRVNSRNPLARMAKTMRIVKEGHYNIVHSHTNFSSAFHLFAAWLGGSKIRIAHSHTTVDGGRKSVLGDVYRFISKQTINIFATQKASCGVDAAQFLFLKPEQAIVIPNSVDVDYLGGLRAFVTGGNESSTGSNRCIHIFQVGRFVAEKNHLYSVKIAQKLKEMGIDFKLKFVGRGPLEEAVKNAVQDANLQNYVQFLGVRSDVPQLMACADCLILPSHFEGFPVVLVEAQAVGLTSIVSDNVSSEVDLGVNLIKFVPLDKIDLWVDSIVSLIDALNRDNVNISDTDERLHVLKQKGFDISTNVKRLEKLYN